VCHACIGGAEKCTLGKPSKNIDKHIHIEYLADIVALSLFYYQQFVRTPCQKACA